MKRILLAIFTLLLIAVPCSAEIGTKPVAIKVEDGVYLSWMMEEEGKEYTVFRDGEAVITTTQTNYLDKGATGEEKYMINSTPVDVWEKQYLEIPVSIPKPYQVDIPTLQHVTLSAGYGKEITLGNEWYLYDYGNGYNVLLDPQGKCLDVLDRRIESGTEVIVYLYTNADNQRFAFEEENG